MRSDRKSRSLPEMIPWDEDDDLPKVHELSLVADGLLLVTTEAGGVVNEEAVKQVESGVFEDSLKLPPFEHGTTGDELGVPSVSQGKVVFVREPCDVVALDVGTEPISLVPG